MNALLPGVRHEGSIRLDDTDVYSKEMDPVSLRRRVGMVAEQDLCPGGEILETDLPFASDKMSGHAAHIP